MLVRSILASYSRLLAGLTLALLAIALLMADGWIRRVPGWGMLRFRGLLRQAVGFILPKSQLSR